MTVSSTAARRTHAGNDSATVFSFDFAITAADDLVVTVTAADGSETLLVRDSDYGVAVAAYPGSGSITYPLDGPPLPAGARLTLQRVLTIDQQIDLQNQGNFYAETHEAFFDKVVMICQQLADAVGRAAQLPVASPLVRLLLPQPAAGRALLWNAEADGLANGPTADEIAAAQAQAAAAVGAATAAAEARESAEAWADRGVEMPVEPGRYSARHWAAHAAASAAGLALPAIGGGDAGAMLRVRPDAGGYELRSAEQVVTDIGALREPVAAQATSFSIGVQDAGSMYLVDATAGPVTASMPSATEAGPGFITTIKKTDSTANPITLNPPDADTIDGLPILNLPNQHDVATLISDGTRWLLKSRGRTPILQLAQYEAAAVADVMLEWSNDETYSEILLVLEALAPTSNGASLRLQSKIGGEYIDVGAAYQYDGITISASSSGAGGSAATSVDLAFNGVGSTFSASCHGRVSLYNPGGSGRAYGEFSTTYLTSAGLFARTLGGFVASNAGPATGVRLFFNSGNIASGRVSLYARRV